VNLGSHADFIVAAYGVAVLVIALLVGWVVLDRRAQKNKLAQLEAGGMTRRSERAVERTA